MRGFARVVKRLVLATGFLTIYGGIAAGLVIGVGWPLPHHWPATSEWLAWINNDRPLITTRFLIDAFACLVWLGWGYVAGLIVLNTLHRLREKLRHPHIRIPVRRQGLVGGLVSALVLGTGRAAAAHTGGDPLAAATPQAYTATADQMAYGQGAITGGHGVPPPSAEPTVSTAGGQDATPVADTTRRPRADGAASDRHDSRYVVRHGDTLWDIAADRTGDPMDWTRIWRANRGGPMPDGSRFTDPDLIEPGQVLLVPAGTAPAHRAHQHSRQPTPGRSATHPTPDRSPASPAPSSTPQQASSTAPDKHSHNWPLDGLVPAAGPGVLLRSGSYLGLGLLLAVAAALAVHRRRHRHAPAPAGAPPATAGAGRPPADADTTGQATTTDLADAARQTGLPADAAWLRLATPALPDPHGGAATIPAGQTPDGTQLDLSTLGVDGFCLTGPGAAPAARGVLAATLTAGAPLRLDDQATAVIPAATLHRLLGNPAPAIPERLTVTDSLAAALDHLDTELVHRTRLADQHTPDTDPQPRPTAPAAHPGEPVPPLVLVADSEPGQGRRLAATAALGARLGITVVLLGTHPQLPGWQISADGHATPLHPGPDSDAGPRPRLGTLTDHELADLLALLADNDEVEHDHPGPLAEDASAPAPETGATATPIRPPTAESRPADNHPRPPEAPDTPAAPATDGPAPPTLRPATSLRLLGDIQLTADGQPVPLGRTRKPRELLALLAAHPDGAATDTVLEAVCDGRGDATARAQLRKTLYMLRAGLRRVTGRPDADLFHTDTGRYRLDPDLVEVDLWRLLDILDTAEHHPDPDIRATADARAAAIYRHPFAPGADADWAEPYREDLRTRAANAITRHADTLAADGHTDRAQTALATVTGIDPHNEALALKLMRLQADHGHPDAAERTWTQLRRRLADIDTTPTPDTAATARRLLDPSATG